MADRFIVEHVGRLPMFSPLPPELLEALADAFMTTRYERGELIFQQNDPSQGLYLLVTGRGALWQYNGSTMQQIAVIEPNQYLNESALLREGTESATFQVIETAIVLFLSRVNFHATLQRFPAMRSYITLPLGQIAPPLAQGNPAQISANSPLGQQRLTPSTLSNTPNQGQSNYPFAGNPSNQPNQPYQQMQQPTQQPQQSTSNVVTGSPQTPYTTGASPTAAKLLRSGERLLLQTRRHWWAYIRQSWIPIVVGVIMLVVAFAVPADNLRFLILAGTLLVPGALLVYFYLEWRNDQLIITTDRVLRIENTIITFQQWVNEVPIRSIQQVNTDMPPFDLFARVFNYGDVVLRTAGKAGTVKLDFVPDAERVQDLIFEQLNGKQQDQVERRDEQIRDDVQRIVGNLPPEQKRKPKPVTRATEGGFLQTRFVNSEGATVYRKHWLFWLRDIMVPGLVMFGALIAFFLFLAIPGLNTLGVVAYPAAGLAFVVGGLWAFWSDWDWRNDVYIIGEDTVSLIHRRPLWLQNEDDRILISRIDNVIVEISGILRSAFNYGDVRLALIGDTGTKIFSDVPNPRAVQSEISARQTRLRQASVEAEDSKRRDEIAKYIRAYDEARGFNNPGVQSGSQPTMQNPSVQNQSVAPNPNQIPRAAPIANPRYGTGVPNSRPDPLNLPNSNQGNQGRRPPNNRR
jgi:membrane protein YdbS with pleckstrin-like domain